MATKPSTAAAETERREQRGQATRQLQMFHPSTVKTDGRKRPRPSAEAEGLADIPTN